MATTIQHPNEDVHRRKPTVLQISGFPTTVGASIGLLKSCSGVRLYIVVYITSCAGLEGGGGPDPLENSNSLNSYSNITENMPSPSANAIISRTYPHPLGKIFWIVPDIN